MFRVVLVCSLIALTFGATLDRSGRIVGGWFAFPELLPHQVSLKDTTSRLHFCGGFIISERWVGSAAGCTLNRTPENTIILAGTTSLSFGGSTYQVTQIINHEGYFPELRVNDVSLLQTAVPFTYSASIAPIALTVNLVGGGVNGRVSGWGSTAVNGNNLETTNDLHYLTVTTITNADCRARLIEGGHPAQYIFDNSLCTFNLEGQGTCFGDEGGALAGVNGVIGVISWHIQCGAGYPDVYARMSSYRDWFLRNMQ